ncbi:MAG: hypothetical protein M3Z80_04310 [Apibacter sp.]|uniref:hypothetical protein n=1 Tax=Apibacter sp. TaxID=2023709 RepID=UPI0025EA42F1|nr:hypothetical protein [Apibacter sp.]MCT6869150.1 hypothetical protein [Apibacter sp.]
MENKHKTTIDRLIDFMDYKNLNDNKLTKLANLSVGLIGRARRNKSGLHTDTIEKILHTFPELNPTWLLTGNGSMLLSTEDNVIPKNIPLIKNSDTFIDEIFTTQKDIIYMLKKKYFKIEGS